MRPSFPESTHANEDLLALRRVIARLAERHGLDLSDRSAFTRFLDGDYSHCLPSARNHQSCQELRAMLTLLLRLEASNSEDIGIAGLDRLWHQHSEVLTRFHSNETLHARPTNPYLVS